MSFPCLPLIPLFAICHFPLPVLGAPPAEGSPASRLDDLRERIEKTSRLVPAGDGYPAKAGRIDVQVAAWFADYIEWELANPEITKDALMGHRIFHPDAADGPEEAARRYRQHIERELAVGSAEDLSHRMIGTLGSLSRERPLQVQRTDTPAAFGVLHRAVETDEGVLMLLVNVLNRPLTVRLTGKDGSSPRGKDLINGHAVDGAKIDLPVRGVRLVCVD